MQGLAALAEDLCRQTQRTGRPAGMPKEVAPQAVAVVEIDWYHGDLGPGYDLEHRRLPRTVLYAVEESRLAHCPGREETDGITVAQLLDSLTNSVYRHGTFGRIVAGPGIDGDKVGAHGTDLVEYHIDHHLIFGPVARHKIDESYAVEGAKRMIAHGDKRAVLEGGQDILVVDTQLYLEVVDEHTPHEFRAGSVAIPAVNGIDLVDRKKMKQPIHKFLVTVEFRHQFLDIVVVEDIRAYFVLAVVVCLRHNSTGYSDITGIAVYKACERAYAHQTVLEKSRPGQGCRYAKQYVDYIMMR